LTVPRDSDRKGGGFSGEGVADRVFLEGLVLPVRIGVTAAERAALQPLRAEITLAANLEKAGLSDALADAPNYAELRRVALRVAASRTWSLLEALAERIAGALLERFAEVFEVRVTLRKPRPPYMPDVEAAGVTLVRRRVGEGDRPGERGG
jgi:dihydroneopterin aldolase